MITILCLLWLNQILHYFKYIIGFLSNVFAVNGHSTIIFGDQSSESDEHRKKRHTKHRQKNREEEYSRRSGRIKSAYVKQRIPLHIVPTMKDNRMLLHAYPMYNSSQPPTYSGREAERIGVKLNSKFVKKLEYSSAKVHKSVSKHMRSNRKKREMRQKGGQRLDNTLSGEKRSSQSDSNDSRNKRRNISEDSEIKLGDGLKKQGSRTSTMLKITNN